MGGNTSSQKHALIAGLDGSGKSTFLYTNILKPGWDSEHSLGFNFEEIKLSQGRIGLWELGGERRMRELWRKFYKNISVSAIIFLVKVSEANRSEEARAELEYLLGEEELQDVILAIIANREGQYFIGDQDRTEIREDTAKTLGFAELPVEKSKKKIFVMDASRYEQQQNLWDWLAEKIYDRED